SLRRGVPHRAPRGVRAADPRRAAGRRDALHPRGRGGRAVGARRRDRLRLAARPPRVPELRGGNLGTGRGRRAAAPGRARMAQTLKATSVAEIEALLDETPSQRTSVATHMAWVPPEWVDAAERVLHGLGPRIPSRTILLHPDPKAKRDGLDASIEHER